MRKSARSVDTQQNRHIEQTGRESRQSNTDAPEKLQTSNRLHKTRSGETQLTDTVGNTPPPEHTHTHTHTQHLNKWHTVKAHTES